MPDDMTLLVATSLEQAVAELAADPAATLLAGGTDLMVEVNDLRRRMGKVITLNRVPELRTWHHDPAARLLHIGAGITWAEIGREPISTWVPCLAQAALTVGSPQIRHVGTLGGNLATCSPAGDGLPPLAALDAVVHLVSSAGSRSLPFGEFMIGPKHSALQPGELITGVTVPVVAGWQGFSKIGARNSMVIAIVSAALVVDTEHRSLRVALGASGPQIVLCPDAEALVAVEADFDAGRVSAAVMAEFTELVRRAALPIDDHRSTADHRRHCVGVLAGRLLRSAFPHE